MHRNNAAAVLRRGRLGLTAQGCFDIKQEDVLVEGILHANITSGFQQLRTNWFDVHILRENCSDV